MRISPYFIFHLKEIVSKRVLSAQQVLLKVREQHECNTLVESQISWVCFG